MLFRSVAPGVKTTVLLAGDDKDSKEKIMEALSGSPLAVVDAGSLKRARELEATGFLQMTLAARDQTCPIMIQRLNNIFQRNPLISIGI